MRKYIKPTLYIFLFCILFNVNSYAQDDLLTIKQKLDRLQREVNDLSKSVFSNKNSESSIENNTNSQTVNFTAIDMRIYDLEKDIKGLTMNIEEMIFKLDEIESKINSLEINFNDQLINTDKQKSNEKLNEVEVMEENQEGVEENTLGTLKISSGNNSDDIVENGTNLNQENEEFKKLPPEDQFQLAFDKIRKKQYEQAKLLLRDFIKNHPKDQLSGSAHYWLGELLLLEKNNREAALILAEGYQLFPQSIKAPDILYKLADALFAIDKNQEACKTLTKLIKDFPNHKLKNKSKTKKTQKSCDVSAE